MNAVHLSALLLAALGAGPSRDGDQPAIDGLCREALKSWRVPGVAVAIVRDGEVIYLKGHGVRSVEAKEPVTADTLFPIASCTKAFTTAALALLVEQGKLAWDDPVRKHVPFFKLGDPLADREVTLRDLVCHRTGLGPHELLWYRSPWSAEELVRRAGLLPLDKPFRSAFQYQSTLFIAAGLAVPSSSGMAWEGFVQKHFLNPLDMKSTTFTTTAAAKVEDRAAPHRLNAADHLAVIPFYPMEKPDPAGSIQSNARDLAKWLRYHLKSGPDAALAETHTPQMVIRMEGLDRDLFPETHQMSYGMGWVIHDYRGQKIVAHAGAIDGFRVQLTMLPEEKLGVVVLANLHHTRLNLALSNSLVDHLLALPKKDWNASLQAALRHEETRSAEEARTRQARRHHGTQPTRELAAYVGAYDHPAYGTLHIALERGQLVWTWNDFTASLEHYHYDTFTVASDVLAGTPMVFKLDESGAVTAVKVEGRMKAEFLRK